MGASGADVVAVVENWRGVGLAVTLVNKQEALQCNTQKNLPLALPGGALQFYSNIPPLPVREFPLQAVTPRRQSISTKREARVSQATDSFAESLRKYPRNSPVLTSSSELIEKILSTTLSKRKNKETKRSHSLIRSKTKKSLNDKQINYATHKNIQTYSRCKGVTSTVDITNNTNNDMDINAEASTSAKSSPAKVNQGLRDLSPRVQRMGRGAEVRYLNDVRKCIRNAIRHVCEEETVVCPEIQRRLSIHQRECHSEYPHRNTLSSTTRDTPKDLNVSRDIKFRDRNTSATCISHSGTCCRFCREEQEHEIKLLRQVFLWLQEIPITANCSSDDKARRQTMMRKLVDTLIKFKGMEDKQKEEIKRFLDILPMWQPVDQYDRDLFKNKLIENLQIRLNVLSDDDDNLKEIVSNWMDEILLNEIATSDHFIDKDDIINNFIVQIKSLKLDELSNGHNFKETLKMNVINLLKEVPIQNTYNDMNYLNTAADKLVTKITSIQPDHIPSTRQEAATVISDSSKNETCTTSHDGNDTNVLFRLEDDIKKIIKIIKKENLDASTENILIEALTIKLKALPDLKYNTNADNPVLYKNRIVSDSRSEFNLRNQISFTKNQHLQKYIEKKVSQVLEKLPVVINPNMKKDLKDEIISVISRKMDTDQHFEHEHLNDIELNQINAGSGLSDTESLGELSILSESHIRTYVNAQLSSILNAYALDSNSQIKIQNDLTDILTNQIMRGDNDSKFREIAYSVLQEINLPESKMEDLYKTLFQYTKDMSLSFKNKTSHSLKDQDQDVAQVEFLKDIEKEIINFISGMSGSFETELKQKLTPTTKKLAAEIVKILSNGKHYLKDKQEMITKFILRNHELPTDMKSEKFAKQLMKRLLKFPQKTSTPRKRSNENYFPSPRRESTLSSISVDDKYFDTLDQGSLVQIYESDETGPLINNLKIIIGNWITSSKLKTNIPEAVVNDLIRIIINRKQYLRLNPEMQLTNDEEIKYLKEQVLKWLDKIKNYNHFHVDSLINEIIDLHVLMSPNNDVSGSSAEVLKWIQNIPSDRLISHDNNYHKIVAKKITKQIREDFKQHLNPELVLKRELLRWLPKIVKEPNETELHLMTEGLKTYMKEIVSPDINSIPRHLNVTSNLTEKLNKGILEWLMDTPLYQVRNTREKILQEIVSNLAKDLNNIISNLPQTQSIDDNEFILKSIETRIKQLPMDPIKQNDNKYHRKIATEILNHLKGLQIFQNQSENEDAVKINVFSWLQNVPLQWKIPKQEFKAVVDHINLILYENFANTSAAAAADTEYLKNKVINVLKALPLREDFQNYEKLKILVDNLFKIMNNNKLKDTIKQTNIAEKFGKFDETTEKFLLKEISKLCDHLLTNEDNRPEDRKKIGAIKESLVSELLNILRKFNVTSNLVNEDTAYENIVKDEIEQLLNTLFNKEHFKGNLLPFKKDLVHIIKDITQKSRKSFAEDIYKKQLRDAIDKTILTKANFSSEQQTSFEDLKEKLVEAFINLHKITNDNGKYKTKVKQEVNKFCNDYLRRYPATPLVADKLCNELYTALQNVSFPVSESDNSKIEQSKIQDQIERCVAELPLENIETNDLLKHEFVNFLLKNSEEDQQDINLEREIIEWLKLFSFKPELKTDIRHMTKDIINRLKNYNEAEKYNKNINQQQVTQNYAANQGKKSLSQTFVGSFSVNADVANHEAECRPYFGHTVKTTSKDINGNPLSRVLGNQTELRPECWGFEANECATETTTFQGHRCHHVRKYQNINRQTSCTSLNCLDYKKNSTHNRSHGEQTPKQLEVSPRITVKEFHWDSTASCEFDNSRRIPGQLRRTIPSLPLSQKNVPCISHELFSEHSRSTRSLFTPAQGLCQSKISTTEYNLPHTTFPTKQQSLDERHKHKQSNINLTSGNIGRAQSFIPQSLPYCKSVSQKFCNKTTSCTIGSNAESLYRSNDKFQLTREYPMRSLSRSHIVEMPSELVLECSSRQESDREQIVRCRCYSRTHIGCIRGQAHDTRASDHDCYRSSKQCIKCRGALCPHPSYFYFN